MLLSNLEKGPTSVFVTIHFPFIAMHIRGFLGPTEKALLYRNQKQLVLETRDMVMEELTSEIKLNFMEIGNFTVQELYADWHPENESGLLLAILHTDEDLEKPDFVWPDHLDQKAFDEEIIDMSIKGQKEPQKTNSFWLNDRTILIERLGIFVQIEKELIKNGFTENLKLAKRPLEYRLVEESSLWDILQREILETFVDWDFQQDKGYMVLVLKAKRS